MNIIPALVMDLFILDKENANYNSSKNVLVASITMAVFAITLFFPWSVNIYKVYFGIDLDTFESISLFNKLLTPFILPVLVPISIGVSVAGGLLSSKFLKARYEIKSNQTKSNSNEFVKNTIRQNVDDL